ncbi:hypothetical protein Lfu02_53720 [Longispora fulva]|uniref:Uncharacterized protein n=1 Tax=Longispora fulva TaxID=619741 RepID=A0A8J7KNX6_9ACTN|nr:hypothetical protein [Longispora fulva]MBG6140736.1 hypothetical protein [Longispora fulva]GIG61000.1 hypothetical protein Lfu02_53720 [Longispora fulva]
MSPRTGGDLGAFCARVVRFDPGTLVRLSGGAVWARLPFDVLVTRPVEAGSGDVTYRADELLEAAVSPPPSRDAEWRGALPRAAGRTLEEIPAVELRRIADAAAATLRDAPPTLGERRVRDALLEHVAITVSTDDGESAEIPLRLVLGLTRMGFLGEAPVAVRRSGGWTGLVGEFGAAWYRPALTFRTI